MNPRRRRKLKNAARERIRSASQPEIDTNEVRRLENLASEEGVRLDVLTEEEPEDGVEIEITTNPEENPDKPQVVTETEVKVVKKKDK